MPREYTTVLYNKEPNGNAIRMIYYDNNKEKCFFQYRKAEDIDWSDPISLENTKYKTMLIGGEVHLTTR